MNQTSNSVLPRIIRIALKFIAILLLVIFVLLMIVRFSPQTVLFAGNYLSPVKVVAQRVETEFLPLTFRFKNIRVGEDQSQTIAELKALELSADWIDALKGKHNFWDINLSDGVVDLRKLPNQDQPANPQSKSEQAQRLDLHRLITTLSAQVNNVKLIISDNSYVDLNEIESMSSVREGANPNDLLQNIRLKFVYNDGQLPLVIDATMSSQERDGYTDINLHLASIDLHGFVDNANNSSAVQNTAANNMSTQIEAPMDWTWLDLIDPTRFKLAIDKLVSPELEANALVGEIVLEEDINFKVSTNLDLMLSESWRFKDNIQLDGTLAPIEKITPSSDLSGELRFKSSSLDLTSRGKFNLNGQADNAFDLDLSATAMPVITSPPTTQDSLLGKLFPVNATFNFEAGSQNLSLSNIKITMGESDIAGSVNVSPEKFEAKLRSQRIALRPESPNPPVEEDQPVDASEATLVFDENAIDWSWLDSNNLDIQLSVTELIYSNYQLSNVQLPLTLAQGELNIANLSAEFAGGDWTTTIGIQKLDEGAKLSLKSDLSNATLEVMNLIPQDQITDGKTNFSANLVANGSTSKEFAESLKGEFELAIRDGRITNDYFEIIGSDLFLELLSKLNPFVKSDPTTELKCMIAHLKFDEGEIQVDKSIALETSKLSVVADGDIDLINEKIDLKIVPRTENGIGLGMGTLVKSVSLGGTLLEPVPHVTAGDLLKSGLALGAALTTGGTSLLADGVFNKAVGANACKRAEKAFTDEALELDKIEEENRLEQERILEQQKLAEEQNSTID